MTDTNSARGGDVVRDRKAGCNPWLTAGAALFLVFLWHRNYNLLGDLNDYSVLTAVCGHFRAGMTLYRDIVSPLQSLSCYICYAAEGIFGQRYLALGYGNLVLGLLFFFLVLILLNRKLPPALALLSATALVAATFFQHGIIWYNSVATFLLDISVLYCAHLLWHRRLHGRDVATLGALLLLSSMNKINFHMLTMGLVFFMLGLLWALERGNPSKYLGAAAILLVCGVVLGPVIEILVNRTTLHDFVENVFVIPQGRGKKLSEVLNPYLYFGNFTSAYPDNWCGGVYFKTLLLYCVCIYLVFRRGLEGFQGTNSAENWILKWGAALSLPIFFVSGLLLTATNWDTQLLTSSFVIVGLAAVYIIIGQHMSRLQRLGFQGAIFMLGTYFLVTGGLAAFMHSRVRAGERPWTDAMLEQMYNHKGLAALNNAVPFYPAEQIDPHLNNYFRGVRFTGLSGPRMKKISTLMEKNGLYEHPEKVFWGPGLEILNRVYGESQRGRLPLWYHLKVTVRDQDAPRLIAEWKKDDYEWIITGHWYYQVPEATQEWVTQNYTQMGDEDVIVFKKIHQPNVPGEPSTPASQR